MSYANVGASGSGSSGASANLHQSSLAQAQSGGATGTGTGTALDAGEGDDLPGGPIWAELGSQMPQHSGGRAPSLLPPQRARTAYQRKFRRAKARWEEVTRVQVECKRSLGGAVAKMVRLQAEMDYLLDMIGELRSAGAQGEDGVVQPQAGPSRPTHGEDGRNGGRYAGDAHEHEHGRATLPIRSSNQGRRPEDNPASRGPEHR